MEIAMTPEERKERLHRAMQESGQSAGESPRRRQYYGYEGTEAPVRRNVSTERTSPRHASAGRTASKRSVSSRKKSGVNWGQILLALLISAVIILCAVLLIRKIAGNRAEKKGAETETETVLETAPAEPEMTEPPTEALSVRITEILSEARVMAAMYDYDGAMELVNSDSEVSGTEEAKAFIAECEAVKETLVRQDVSKITHIFFHILTVDPDNSFSESKWGSQARGYNSLMTTIPEFKAILQAMYEKGYVLVSLHDMGTVEKQEDGTEKMIPGDIMLPPGKQAFVMSEDDVCYYEYMKGAGFADKMIIGEDGRPTLHYTDKDGNESVGDYDLVPILDHFIDEHPDFCYHGHKACLVFTGYNGVLGYRTDETYLPENYVEHKVEGGHDVEAERKEAVKVLKALYEDGYDLGSHSWGHRDMGAMSVDSLKTDMDKWERNVDTLIEEATGQGADILIYPKGADIGDWRGYDTADQQKEGCLSKFNYLYDIGFRYFCNVDSAQYWVQVGSKYIRTGRRALDGYNFYYDIVNQKGRFTDLWEDTNAIFDPVRPTPVDPY